MALRNVEAKASSERWPYTLCDPRIRQLQEGVDESRDDDSSLG